MADIVQLVENGQKKYIKTHMQAVEGLTDELAKCNLSSGETLWTGVQTMNVDHTITPSKPLSMCQNGWIIYWSTYTGQTPYEHQTVRSVIHKSDVKISRGTFAFVDAFMNSRSAKPAFKGYTVTDTVIKGQSYNVVGENLTLGAYKIESF